MSDFTQMISCAEAHQVSLRGSIIVAFDEKDFTL